MLRGREMLPLRLGVAECNLSAWSAPPALQHFGRSRWSRSLPSADRCFPLLPVASRCFPWLPVASSGFPLLPVASRCVPVLSAVLIRANQS